MKQWTPPSPSSRSPWQSPAPVPPLPGPRAATGSWIGGSTEICDGVFVYHDCVYDDCGATAGDPNAGSTGTLSRTAPGPMGTDPVPWTAQEFLVTRQQPVALQSRIEATLANVASLEIDTSDQRGACVAGGPISYETTTDGPVQFAFSDGSVLSFPSAGTYTGTPPEPGPLTSLVAGAALMIALGRWRAA